jgi:CRP-like cAMP-binding protein
MEPGPSGNEALIKALQDRLSMASAGKSGSTSDAGLRCDNAEKRLAHFLLSHVHFKSDAASEALIPKMQQGTLAEIVGTTRSRISHFMNGFRDSGFINYAASSDTIHVRRSLSAFYAR